MAPTLLSEMLKVSLILSGCWLPPAEHNKEPKNVHYLQYISVFLHFPALQNYSVSLHDVNIEIAVFKMYAMCQC